MPADAYVMDADMKKVADAIRAKSKKTGLLVFPDGFVNEIDGLSGFELTIDKNPTGFQIVNQAPNTEGMVVSISVDGVKNTIQNYSVSPAEWTATGMQTLTVSYGGVSASTSLNVVAPYLEIVTPPTGTQMVGKAPNTEGMVVEKVTGTQRENVTARCTFTPTTWTMEGAQRLTATCDGLSAYTTVTVISRIVYGVRIDSNNSSPSGALTYTDDATGFTPMTRNSAGSWADSPLIAGIKPVMRMSNGTWKDLNKRNLASGADITTLGNDVFTEFPTWWLSVTASGSNYHVRLSNQKVDGTYFKMASLFNGSDVGMFHLGCWHAHNSGNRLYSSANKSPRVDISHQDCHDFAQARGAGFDYETWYQWDYLKALFVILFKTLDGQSALGKGYTSGGSVTTENRTTYDNDYGMAGSSSGTDQMSFFWINNWWGNIYDWVGGAKTDGSKRLMTLDKGEPCNPSSGAWVTQDTPANISMSGYISKMNMKSTKAAFFPVAAGGSTTTYWCDRGYVGTSSFPVCGGYYGGGGSAGPFVATFNSSPSGTGSYYGSRLSYRAGRA